MFLSVLNPRRRPHLPAAIVVALFAAACSRQAPEPRRVTIAFSNDMKGEIRSCGCASKDVGGLGRRATFLAALRDTTVADFLLLEGGGFFSPKLNYGKQKADLTLDAMSMMDYDGVVLGEEDLGFGVDYIVKRAREVGLPVVVANLVDSRADTLFFPPSRRLTLPSGLPVALIGVMSPRLRLPPQVEPGTARISDPRAAVKREIDRLGPEPGLVILLAHMSRQEATQLVREFDQIDLVVHGSEGRPMRNVTRHPGAYLLQVADRGRYMGVAYLVLDDAGGRIRRLQTAVTPMGKEYADAPDITRLFEAYDLNIATRETSNLPPPGPCGGICRRRRVPRLPRGDRCRVAGNSARPRVRDSDGREPAVRPRLYPLPRDRFRKGRGFRAPRAHLRPDQRPVRGLPRQRERPRGRPGYADAGRCALGLPQLPHRRPVPGLRFRHLLGPYPALI